MTCFLGALINYILIGWNDLYGILYFDPT